MKVISVNIIKIVALFTIGLVLLTSQTFAGAIYSTKPATNVTSNSFVMNGVGQSTNGLAGEAFLYGTSLDISGSIVSGTPVAAQFVSSSGSTSNFDYNLTHLSSNTTYYYQFSGTPRGSTVQGVVLSATTSATVSEPGTNILLFSMIGLMILVARPKGSIGNKCVGTPIKLPVQIKA